MSNKFLQSIVQTMPSTRSCFKSAESEDKFEGSINPAKVVFNTRAEFVQLLSQHLRVSEIILKNGNEDDCLWLLETFCQLVIGVGRESVILQLESCCIDERFFVFLRTSYTRGGDRIELYLNGACSFTTSQSLDDEDAMIESLSAFSAIEVIQTRYKLDTNDEGEIYFLLVVKVMPVQNQENQSPESRLGRRKSCLALPGSFPHPLHQKEQKRFVVLQAFDVGLVWRNKISDSPWLLLLLRLPNLAMIFICEGCVCTEFAHRAFDEFTKRPANSLPCHYQFGNMTSDPILMLKVLDNLNATQMTNLDLSLRGGNADQVLAILEKAPMAISNSVHLRIFRYFGDEDLYYNANVQFFRELNNAARMPFPLDVECFPMGRENSELVRQRKRFVFRCTSREFQAFTVLLYAVTVGSNKMGPSCFISMLNGDILRHLHAFLFNSFVMSSLDATLSHCFHGNG